MSEIDDDEVEWAVVDRLRRLLKEEQPNSEYEVTMTFAFFTGIIMWSCELLSNHKNDEKPHPARTLLDKKASDIPWDIDIGQRTGIWKRKKNNLDLKGATIWEIVEFVRDNIAHGDHLRVKPQNSEDQTRSLFLEGFRFHSAKDNVYVYLSKDNMVNIGTHLAEVICDTYNLNANQKEDLCKMKEVPSFSIQQLPQLPPNTP
jgi:hypothetical protein